MKPTSNASRRTFLKTMSVAGLGSLAVPKGFANIHVPRPKDKLGVALVGLGYYSTDVLAPALQLTQHCELKGIVTGSPEKIPVWQEKYGIEDQHVYNYQTMHRLADDDAIDVVYIVLPPALHCAYSIIGSEAGKHVWCEKPMAMTEAECQAMINAAARNQRTLTIGYRLQHEPNTQVIMDYARNHPYGKIVKVRAEAAYYDSRTDHWKQDKALGGGAMYDMGVYPLNAARYATGEEPIAVTARHETNRPEVYHEVDETTHFELEFPSGARAQCMTSLGMRVNELHVDCAEGWYELKPFQGYRNVRGQTSDGKTINKPVPLDNQQANQMDNDAMAIKNNTELRVPGEEGLRDIRVVEAIYIAAATKTRVTI